MVVSEQQVAPRRPRPRLRTAQVRRVTRLTPSVVRVTLAGQDLEGFGLQGPACHMKLFVPPTGQRNSVPVESGPEGPQFPADQPRPMSRTYTPRRFDPAALELDVDVVLHGDGPGAFWASNAQPGDTLVLAGPSRPYQVDPAADWYLIAGDDTAVPAISTLLEALPATARARVLVEVEDPAEELPLDSPAQLDVTWLHRNGQPAGQRLEAAIREAQLPDGSGRVWVACEAAVMRSIRRHLLHERGLAPTAVTTRGYWQLGEANHPDHDYGEDVA